MKYETCFLLIIQIESTTGRVSGEKGLAVYMSMVQLPRSVLLLVCSGRAKRPPLEFLRLWHPDFSVHSLGLSLSVPLTFFPIAVQFLYPAFTPLSLTHSFSFIYYPFISVVFSFSFLPVCRSPFL
jgi:hypothetical protein